MTQETNKIFLYRKLRPLNLIVMLVLALFTPFFAKAVLSDFTDDFDSYEVGDFRGQSDWQVYASNSVYIWQNDFLSAPQSLWFKGKPYGTTSRIINGYLVADTEIEEFSFWHKVLDASTTGNNSFVVRLYNSVNNDCVSFDARQQTTGAETDWYRYGFFYNPFPTFYSFGVREINQWVKFSVQIDYASQLQRWKMDEGNWTEWYGNPYNCSSGINRLNLDSSYDCAAGSCDNIIFDNFLTGDRYGICGGESDCSFCETQETCEANACLWTAEWLNETTTIYSCVPFVPYIEEYASTTFDCDNYYSEHSDYGTSTLLYSMMCGRIFAPISITSGWLDYFSDRFDLSIAQESGYKLGGSVPKVRGYLSIFNSILGSGFPLSEVLIFYLLFYIAVIVFKKTREMKQLLPFQ